MLGAMYGATTGESGRLMPRLKRAFPRAVEEAALEVAALPPVEFPRRDLTELPTFTIDPVTARDYDDAISAIREDGGRLRVWVHIADVGAYVRPGGVIVYSTCSIEPEEDGLLVRALLKEVPGLVLEAEEERTPGRPADGGYWARLRWRPEEKQ